ncbi:hypothetical protein VYU27_004805 [Nannochloropsis oceanica]
MALPHRTPLILVTSLLAMVAVAHGFFLRPSTLRVSTIMTAHQQLEHSPATGLDRKAALQQGVVLTSVFLFVAGASPLPVRAKDNKPAALSFEECVSKLLLSKKVLQPVAKYIKIGQYDPARTNIKYVTNQFRLKKAMERIVLLAFEKDVSQSKLDEAAEVTAVIDNTLSQLDSSVYTQIFIPTDGEISPDALKYQKQAFEFYDTVLDSIDKVLSLAGAEDISAAQKLVDGTPLPSFLFKQFADGQTFRPPTP